MTVLHHLDDSTLLRYASGDLDEAFSVVVASHIAMCEECRHALRAAEDLGGELLDTQAPGALAPDALDQIMSSLDMSPEQTERPVPRPGPSSNVPLPLRRLVGDRLETIPWKSVAPGVRRHQIKIDAPSSLYMLYIAPNKAVPEHGHGGSEMTLILSGAYRDALGRFAPGDIADLDEHVEHQPRVEPDEPCICLVATETQTRFKGIFSRLLQPLVGI